MKRNKKPKKVTELSYQDTVTTLASKNGLTEEQIEKMLHEELKQKRRKQVIFRLHRRFNRLRYLREKKEYGIEEIRE